MILNAVYDGMDISWRNFNGAIINNDYEYNM